MPTVPSASAAPSPASPGSGAAPAQATALANPPAVEGEGAPTITTAPAKSKGLPLGALPPLPEIAAPPEPESAEAGSQVATPTPVMPLGGMPKPDIAKLPAGMPMLPLPGGATPMAPLSTATTLPAGLTPSIPEITVEQDKPVAKSWMTTLAPPPPPPQTRFNYRRNVLPPVLYRTGERDLQNPHLPALYTRDDYANLLFRSIASNDVEATRALLNAGTGVNVTNVAGETPLALARRTGSVEVAALLIARGARP
ncbi:MAG: hypothetical protein V4735_05755 [Pseudomonadota bacterium]